MAATRSQGTSTRDGFVAIPGGPRLHVLANGRPGRGSLLFIPGWTMPATVWQPQLEYFGPIRGAVAMEPRGHGLSAVGSGPHTPLQLASDVWAVAAALELEPVVLVAWSLAVMGALCAVDRFGSSWLAALVLVDGVPARIRDSSSERAHVQVLDSLTRERRRTTESFVRSMFRKRQPGTVLRRLVDAALATPAEVALELLSTAAATDCRSLLPRLACPTLVVAAAEPVLAAQREMAAAIPGCRLEVIHDAGHAVFMDQPSRFNAVLERFLAELP